VFNIQIKSSCIINIEAMFFKLFFTVNKKSVYVVKFINFRHNLRSFFIRESTFDRISGSGRWGTQLKGNNVLVHNW